MNLLDTYIFVKEKIGIIPYNSVLIFAIVAAYILFNILDTIIYTVIAIIYPVMASISILSDPLIDEMRMSNNIKYWVIYGIFTLINNIFGTVLDYVFGYNFLKIIFVYALIQKNFVLSTIIYDAMTSTEIFIDLYKFIILQTNIIYVHTKHYINN